MSLHLAHSQHNCWLAASPFIVECAEQLALSSPSLRISLVTAGFRVVLSSALSLSHTLSLSTLSLRPSALYLSSSPSSLSLCLRPLTSLPTLGFLQPNPSKNPHVSQALLLVQAEACVVDLDDLLADHQDEHRVRSAARVVRAKAGPEAQDALLRSDLREAVLKNASIMSEASLGIASR